MGYFQGLAAAPTQQQNTPAIPNAPTGVVSGSTTAQGQPQAYGSFSMAQAPNAVLNNINAYNGGQFGTIARAGNEQQGLNNYLQQSQQYGQQPGVYQPWAFQDKAAGGYGSNGYDVGNMFGVGGGQASQIQAGSNYAFGQDPRQIMQSQYYRNPYTGEIERTGQAQSVDNPYRGQYDMGMQMANHYSSLKGMGLGNEAYQNNLNTLGNDYYGSITSGFGQGQFDTSNFNKSATMSFVNPYNGASAGVLGSGPDYMGVRSRAPSNNQPNYMGG